MEGASVVLGSATPSLEAFYACECGRYQMLRLRNRTGKQALPEVYVADMREELKHGNRSILSDRLKSTDAGPAGEEGTDNVIPEPEKDTQALFLAEPVDM